MKIATGCQDGLIRIFDTCSPTSAPKEIKVSNAFEDAITKLHWHLDHLLYISKRNGAVQLWDLRTGTTAPTQSAVLTDGKVAMDMELHPERNAIITASGKEVTMLTMDELRSVRVYEMPTPMNFNEEGGVSLSPDGNTFVSVFILLYI